MGLTGYHWRLIVATGVALTCATAGLRGEQSATAGLRGEQSATEQRVEVDCAADVAWAEHRASGFLHGFSPDGRSPSQALVVPLKIRLHRTRPDATWLQAHRMKRLGISQQVVVSGGWGYEGPFPGDNGDWAAWEAFVGGIARKARHLGLRLQYDIWNEPDDATFFWPRSQAQFREAWLRAVRRIRREDRDAVIVGPSWSGVYPGDARFDAFLLFCRDNQVMPDYVAWHFPRDVVKEAEAVRRFCAVNSLRVRGLMVNEHTLQDERYCGRTAWQLARLERARIYGACHAAWDRDVQNLGGTVMLEGGERPKGRWWVYERYADITGRLLRTTAGSRVEVVAGKDGRRRSVRALLGIRPGPAADVRLVFRNVGVAASAGWGSMVRVVVERIPEHGGGAVSAPEHMASEPTPLRDGCVEVAIRWISDRDAYAVRLDW